MGVYCSLCLWQTRSAVHGAQIIGSLPWQCSPSLQVFILKELNTAEQGACKTSDLHLYLNVRAIVTPTHNHVVGPGNAHILHACCVSYLIDYIKFATKQPSLVQNFKSAKQKNNNKKLSTSVPSQFKTKLPCKKIQKHEIT